MLLGENIWEYLYDLGRGKGFSKDNNHERKNQYVTLHYKEELCLSTYTLRIGKSDWQKIPAKNI